MERQTHQRSIGPGEVGGVADIDNLSRRIWRTLLGIVMAGCLTLMPMGAPAHARPTFGIGAGVEEDLGEPVSHLNSSNNGLTTTSEGRPLALLVANSTTAVFSAVDVNTGELVFQQELTNASGVLGMATAPDGRVYLGTSYQGQVWRFDPSALTLTTVSEEFLFGQTNLRKMAVGPDGTVYIGTYPDGLVISYDPDTEQWTNHGGFGDDITYVQSIAVDGRTVFAGTAPRATVFELDLDTGAKTEIPLPAAVANDANVWGIEAYEGTVYVLPVATRTLVAYDRDTRTWTEVDTRVAFHSFPEPRTVTLPDASTRHEIYYVSLSARTLRGDDPTTGTRRDLPLPIHPSSSSSIDWAWADLGIGGEFPGESLVGTDGIAGKIYTWNPTTNATKVLDGAFGRAHAMIRSVNEGPDGNIYVSGYASATGLIRIDPDTGEATALAGPAQIEQTGSNGSRLVLGLYGGAQIYDYDTTQPWNFGTNPRGPIRLGHDQDRITSISAVDNDTTAVSSFPLQGRIGGALALYHHQSRTVEVFRNVVQDQTPLELVHRDGLIYGGTGISVGLGTDPTTTEGHLFIFDVASRQVIFSTVPVPGEQNVAGLAFDANGTLWGMTRNTIFTFDPITRTVTHVERYSTIDDSDPYVVGRDLIVLPDRILGHNGRELFVVDPQTWERTVLARKDMHGGSMGIGIDHAGRYYYSNGTHVYRWTPCGADARDNPACAALQRGR